MFYIFWWRVVSGNCTFMKILLKHLQCISNIYGTYVMWLLNPYLILISIMAEEVQKNIIKVLSLTRCL